MTYRILSLASECITDPERNEHLKALRGGIGFKIETGDPKQLCLQETTSSSNRLHMNKHGIATISTTGTVDARDKIHQEHVKLFRECSTCVLKFKNSEGVLKSMSFRIATVKTDNGSRSLDVVYSDRFQTKPIVTDQAAPVKTESIVTDQVALAKADSIVTEQAATAIADIAPNAVDKIIHDLIADSGEMLKSALVNGNGVAVVLTQIRCAKRLLDTADDLLFSKLN